ncbi:MAG TPA: signal recognition particle protein [Bdellovibrionota bacterium]|nr:signal recognition particle protein [Bdellovibrionota bacterium]
MFDRLQERLGRTFRTLRGLGKIRESNISEALAEVRESLLEADVSYRVVQSFIDTVRQRALGTEVLDSVEPGQQFIKILHDELVQILGGQVAEIPRVQGRPLTILMAGLQGSGKTTTAAKIAKILRDQRGERPLLVPADTQRPAAREQLIQLGQKNGLTVFASNETDPVAIVRAARRAVEQREIAANCLVIDTAGRLHIDEALMEELKLVRDAARPDSVLYVLDAMAGQDAVRSAETFVQKIGFDGVIVTKMDGDARGGAALSVRWTTGKPILFVGTGESVEAIEPLHPDRMASRILGMGDVVSLVEKAQEAFDLHEADKLSEKLRKNQFTIADFAEQLEGLKKMGSFEQLMEYLPGGAQMKQALAGGVPEKEFKVFESIIRSMTPRERTNHQIIDGSRRKRIASGSGTSVKEVNRFLKQFLAARSVASRIGRLGAAGIRRGGLFPK